MEKKDRGNANIIVDIIITNNGELRALRPIYDSHNAMPLKEPEKSVWLKTHANTDRLRKRILGNIGGRSLNKVKRLANASIIGSNNNIINDNTYPRTFYKDSISGFY
jgi:hypothetical protein